MELKHHGILGMRWGFRRYQNPDGSLTEAGKRRYRTGNVKNAKDTNDKKPKSSTSDKDIKTMTDAELRDRIARLQLEKQYYDLIKSQNPPPEQKVSKGKKFVEKALKDSGDKIAEKVIASVATYMVGTMVNKAFGKTVVNFNDVKDLKNSDKKGTSKSKSAKKVMDSVKTSAQKAYEEAKAEKGTTTDKKGGTSEEKKVYSGTVHDDPSYKGSKKKKTSSHSDFVDVEYREVSSDPSYNTGHDIVQQYLTTNVSSLPMLPPPVEYRV